LEIEKMYFLGSRHRDLRVSGQVMEQGRGSAACRSNDQESGFAAMRSNAEPRAMQEPAEIHTFKAFASISTSSGAGGTPANGGRGARPRTLHLDGIDSLG
jgi:hypothetical protein